MSSVVSTVEELRASFAQEAEVARLFKRLPARSGQLVAEYKPVEKKDAEEGIKLDDDIIILGSALVQVHFWDPANEAADERGLVPIGAWAGKPELDPVGYGRGLAEIIGFNGSDRDLVLALFEGNTLALANHAGEVAQWSVNTKDEAYQDFTIARS